MFFLIPAFLFLWLFSYRLPIGGDVMTKETDWNAAVRNFATWSWRELTWQIFITVFFAFHPFICPLDIYLGDSVCLDESLLFLFHAQEVCCFLPVFTVLSAFASLLFNLPAVLTHAAPVPWISQDCLVRLHILSALPCIVSAISTSSFYLCGLLCLHLLWFSPHYPLYGALLSLLLSIAVACSMTNAVDDL